MNDMVSIRKMRPWAASVSQPADLEDGTTRGLDGAGVALTSGVVGFFRAGPALCLAAGSRLKIDPEIRLNDFVGFAAAGILKDKVVLDGLCDGRWQVEIHCLVVRVFDRKQRFAWVIVGERGLLLLVHDDELNVRSFIGRTMSFT